MNWSRKKLPQPSRKTVCPRAAARNSLKTHLASGGFRPAQEAIETVLVTSIGQGVAPMEIYTYQRPAALPAACAPTWAGRATLTASAVRATLTADPRFVSQAQQAHAQSELTLALAPAGTNSTNGTFGFAGKDILTSKRMDVRGVPPRGRPV
jgi:hypothetical protein